MAPQDCLWVTSSLAHHRLLPRCVQHQLSLRAPCFQLRPMVVQSLHGHESDVSTTQSRPVPSLLKLPNNSSCNTVKHLHLAGEVHMTFPTLSNFISNLCALPGHTSHTSLLLLLKTKACSYFKAGPAVPSVWTALPPDHCVTGLFGLS